MFYFDFLQKHFGEGYKSQININEEDVICIHLLVFYQLMLAFARDPMIDAITHNEG